MIPVAYSLLEERALVTEDHAKARDRLKAEMDRVSNIDLWADLTEAEEAEIMSSPPIPGIREMPLG